MLSNPKSIKTDVLKTLVIVKPQKKWLRNHLR